MKRNYVYVMQPIGPYGTRVINYAADNNAVNDFLAKFDIFDSRGEFKLSRDGKTSEVWFELSRDMWSMLQRDEFIIAFNRMGVLVIFDPSDNEQEET